MNTEKLHSLIVRAKNICHKVASVRKYIPDHTPTYQEFCEMVAAEVKYSLNMTADELQENALTNTILRKEYNDKIKG